MMIGNLRLKVNLNTIFDIIFFDKIVRHLLMLKYIYLNKIRKIASVIRLIIACFYFYLILILWNNFNLCPLYLLCNGIMRIFVHYIYYVMELCELVSIIFLFNIINLVFNDSNLYSSAINFLCFCFVLLNLYFLWNE